MHRRDESLGERGSACSERPSRSVHHVRVPARVDKLTETRRELAAWAHRQGLSAELVQSVELASYEAMANVAEHAYGYGTGSGELELRAIASATRVDVVVTDRGHWRAPCEGPKVPSGLGIPLILRLADHAEIDTGDHGTVVSMTWFR